MNYPMGERFSDDKARAILARAIELDAQASLTTAEDLRAIAEDLGVSRAALDAALQEHAAPVPERAGRSGERAATVVAGLGLPLGAAVGWLLGLDTSAGIAAAAGATGVGLAASGALLVLQGRKATLRSFHLRNLALWAGVAAGGLAGIALAGNAPTTPVLIAVGWCLRSWLASGILGSAAVIAVRRAAGPDGPSTGRALPSAAGEVRLPFWLRVARRVAEWLPRPQQRAAHRPRRALPVS